MSIATIWLDGGDWDIDADMSEKLAGTGELGPPAAPLTGGIGTLVLSNGSNTPIHADLQGVLVQRASAPTRYFVTLQGEKIREHLTALNGQVIWRYVAFGTAPLATPPVVDYARWVPYRVQSGRQ